MEREAAGVRRRPGPVLRIVGYFLCFFLLSALGQMAVSVLPRQPLQWASLVATLVAALVAGWVMLSRLDGRPFGALGFALHRGVIGETILGLAFGGALIGVGIVLLLATRSASLVDDGGTAGEYAIFLAWTFLFFAAAAAFEEAIFRGYPYQVLVEWVGPWPATIAASILFAVLHLQNPNITPLAVLNIFLAGVMLSIGYLRTRSLWFATAVHTGWNWTMSSLFDFPVSGLGFDTPLYTGTPTGEDWWTGGEFGPEAGIVGTLVLLAGTIVLARWSRVAPAPRMATLRPLVDTRLQPEVAS